MWRIYSYKSYQHIWIHRDWHGSHGYKQASSDIWRNPLCWCSWTQGYKVGWRHHTHQYLWQWVQRKQRWAHERWQKRQEVGERRSKGVNSGQGGTGGITFLLKIKAHHTVSPTGRNVVFASDMFSILSFLPAFLLHSFLLGCRLPQHALVPVPGG